jgi:hypothetical protein
MLTERLFGLTMSFAEPLYRAVIDIAAPFLGSEQEVRAWLSDERKDQARIPGLGVSFRHMLQTLGTSWGRELIHQDLWVLLAEKKAQKALQSYSVIFDDMRFPNEFAMIKRNGGTCIRIVRPGEARGDTSIGEGLLDHEHFDLTVYNTGTLGDLQNLVGYIVSDILRTEAWKA